MTNSTQLPRLDANKFTHSNAAALVLAKGDAPAFHIRFVSELNEYQLTPKIGATERAKYASDLTAYVAGGVDYESNKAARLEMIYTARRMQDAHDCEAMEEANCLAAMAIDATQVLQPTRAPLADRIASLNAQIDADLAGTRARLAAFDAKQEDWKAAREAAIAKHNARTDYMAYAVVLAMGVAIGLVVACIAASAVLSNLPQ